MNLISEVIIDPTKTGFIIQSGEKTTPIGIDYELDYPHIRVLRVFNYLLIEDTYQGSGEEIEIKNNIINISEPYGTNILVNFASLDKSIYFETSFSEDDEFVNLIIFSKNPVVLVEEAFTFLQELKSLEIVDSENNLIKVINNPNNDEEFNLLSLNYEFTTDTPKFYFRNFIWIEYKKPIFVSNLNNVKIKFI